MLFSTVVSITRLVIVAGLFSLTACGGGTPSDPGGGGTPAPAGHPVIGFVYYDENGNGTLDPAEAVRLPNVTVTVGGRTGQATTGGRFTVANVPAGAQSATTTPGSLPAYFTAATSVPVTVPQAGGDVAVPATLPIQPNRPNVYMAFGDSITAGDGADPGETYPDWLRADLRAFWGKADLINQGVAGTKSYQGEARLFSLLARHRPAYVLILYGTNDWNDAPCRNDISNCETIDALRSMINQTRDFAAQPIVGTIPPVNPAYLDKLPEERNAWVSTMNDQLRAMAQQEQVQIAEIHADLMAEPDLTALFADEKHPNSEGYRVIAGSWFRAITQPLGANSASRRGFFGFSFTPPGS